MNQERRAAYIALVKQILSKMTPNVPGNRYSGQQIAYAKGRAMKLLKAGA